MKEFRNAFLRVLNEAVPAPVNVSPQQPEEPSDSDVWSNKNPGVKEKGLEGQFNVEGIPPEVEQQYTAKIKGWRQEIAQMSQTCEQIYDFASQTSEKPGADTIFAEVSRCVETLLSSIGELEGKMKYLGQKVNVLIARDAKKQRGL